MKHNSTLLKYPPKNLFVFPLFKPIHFDVRFHLCARTFQTSRPTTAIHSTFPSKSHLPHTHTPAHPHPRAKTSHRCLQYMSEYSSCLLLGYGVLPSAPVGVKALNIATRFAIIDWSPPKVMADTVTAYQVYMRRIGVSESFAEIEKDRSPVILEDLLPNAWYESYVVAVNAHGKSDASARLVFRTPPVRFCA